MPSHTADPTATLPDRMTRLLAGLDLAGGLGLEIGPLHNAILRRPGANVLYADHADTRTLREKYAADPDVDGALIVDVDFVWASNSLEALAGPERFDHAVASHVCEHVPDLVWWLAEIRSVLKPYGSLRLIVPDHAYTFDWKRAASPLADVLTAFVQQRRRPGTREILDFWLGYQAVDSAAAWRGVYPERQLPDGPALRAALERAANAAAAGAYEDVHCWVFTPASFCTAMHGLAELSLLGFACTEIHGTAPGEIDFIVHMMKSADREQIVESWRWAAWKVAQCTRIDVSGPEAAALEH